MPVTMEWYSTTITKMLLMLAFLTICLCNVSMSYSIDSGNIQQNQLADLAQSDIYNDINIEEIITETSEQGENIETYNTYETVAEGEWTQEDKRQDYMFLKGIKAVIVGIALIVSLCIKFCCRCYCCASKDEELIVTIDNQMPAYPLPHPPTIA